KTEGQDSVIQDGFHQIAVEEAGAGADEFAGVFLTKFVGTHGAALIFEEAPGDLGAGGGLACYAKPVGSAEGPDFVEEAALAAGGAHHPEIAVGYGEHRLQGVVHFVGDARGFVDQKQRYRREATDGVFEARQPDDARAVREQERDRIISVAAGPDAHARDHAAGLAHPFARLPAAWARDDNEAAWLGERAVQRFGDRDGGLAPLTATVENSAARAGTQHFGLLLVDAEAEAGAREGYGIELWFGWKPRLAPDSGPEQGFRHARKLTYARRAGTAISG